MNDTRKDVTSNPIHCDNCEWSGGEDDVEYLNDGMERLGGTGGGICLLPAGECPKCGALAYYDDQVPAWEVAKASPKMLAALKAIVAMDPDDEGDIILPTLNDEDKACEVNGEYLAAVAAVAAAEGGA